MATKTFYFSGTCKWAKLNKPDTKYNNFGIDLYLDEKSWDAFKKSELQLKVKKDDDGSFVSFKRPVSKLIKGELVDFGKPEMLDAGGQPMDNEILVGNGSEVTCKVVVYDSAKGKGHRLEAVRVDNLIEYGGDTLGNEPEGSPF